MLRLYSTLPLLLLLLCSAAAAQSSNFDVVFDSNRSGTFGIYRVAGPDHKLTKIVDTAQHDMYPAVSPDGQWIAFARTKELEDRDAYSEVFLIKPDGTGERLLIKDATFPSFTEDGRYLIVERRRRAVLRVSLADGSAQEIFPKGHPKFQRRFIVKPLLSPDGSKIAFTSNLPDRWNAWFVDLKSGDAQHIGHGCEPSWAGGSDRVAWVQRGRLQGGSGINVMDAKTKSRSSLVDFPHPHGYEYFPHVSADGKFVVYAAAREGEHSHYDSNYQIFVKDLSTGKRMRLTEDEHTNRWPRFIKTPS